MRVLYFWPMTKEALAREIYDVAHLTGEFLLRSGTISNEYFDKYQFESNPVLLREIAEHCKGLVPAGTEVLAGLELGGVSIAAVPVSYTHLTLPTNREV